MLAPLTPLVKALQAKVPNVVSLCGKEAYLLKKALVFLEQSVIAPNSKDWNYESFVGGESESSQIISSANQIPWASSHRLVVVKQVEEFTKEELESFIKYLESPNTSACLVFVAENPDLRTRFFSVLKQKSLWIKLEALSKKQIKEFVRLSAEEQQVFFEEEAIDRLVDSLEPELVQVEDAINKLIDYAGKEKRIFPRHVEILIPHAKQYDTFEWIDSFFSGETNRTWILLERLLFQRESALKMIALLGRQVRLLKDVLWLQREQKAGMKTIIEELKVIPYVAGKLIEQSRGVSIKKLEKMGQLLFETEKKIKSTGIAERLYMESLLCELEECRKSM